MKISNTSEVTEDEGGDVARKTSELKVLPPQSLNLARMRSQPSHRSV